MKIDKEKIENALNNKKIMKVLLIAFIGLAIAFYGLVYSFRMIGITVWADYMFQFVQVFALASVVIYIYMMFKFDKKNAKKKEIADADKIHFQNHVDAYCGDKSAVNLSKDWNKVNCADCLEKNITVTLEQQLEEDVVSPEKEDEKE